MPQAPHIVIIHAGLGGLCVSPAQSKEIRAIGCGRSALPRTRFGLLRTPAISRNSLISQQRGPGRHRLYKWCQPVGESVSSASLFTTIDHWYMINLRFTNSLR